MRRLPLMPAGRRARAVVAASTIAVGVALAAPALAGPELPTIPRLPDLSDCEEVNDFFGVDNVRECDNSGGRSTVAVAGPPSLPVPVSVDRRPDGSLCVTISEQVPQCVGPLD